MLEDYAKIQPAVKKDIDDAIRAVIEKFQKDDQYRYSKLQSHTHNNLDTLPVDFSNIANKKFPVHWTIPGAQSATASNYGTFWTAPFPCVVIGFTEIHQTAGSAVGTVSLQLEKLTGTTAPDSGITLLTSALSLKTTADTLQEGNIVITYTSGVRDASLAVGDRLCLKDSGTLTAVSNVSVVVLIKY